MTIQFEVCDHENGFFVEFEVPYSITTLESILRIRGSRNIRTVGK